MVQRWLRASGYAVTYVRNITDIDDMIIRRAADNNESIHSLTQRFIDAMHEDADALGVQRPEHEPRATQYVPQMLEMIGKLEANGLAYQAADGDVNYAVRKFAGYGKLSGKSLEDLRAGERVDVATDKNDPLDFVLWKAAKENEADEVKWDSKWGRGRPGWHIECSAMGSDLLGKHFDIHGGGADLQFPHHENEIAQSEGAHQCQYVNTWMHNGFVRVDNEKMSKSLGNFFTIREVLKQYDAEVVRFFILRAHYRSPLNYSDAHLDDAKGALTRLYMALKGNPPQPSLVREGAEGADSTLNREGAQGTGSSPDGTTSHSTRPSKDDSQVAGYDKGRLGGVDVDWNEPHAARFRAAMDDDFNTPEAIAVLFDLANEVNKTRSPQLAAQLVALAGVLGLLQRDPQEFLQGGATAGGLDEAAIGAQIAARIAAKKNKDFASADRIRKELLEAGIVLEDGAAGTSWRRA
ncbi:MAG: cysteine--tRNA ligase [Gallionella sp.]|nr:cysteine--tRNA ligase [Gallionella sp.]